MPNMTLTYDADSRLTQTVHTQNGTEQYGYTPYGQRVWKKNGANSYEVFFYGVQGELLASFVYSTAGGSYSTQMRQGPMYYFAGRKLGPGTNGTNNVGNWEDRLGSDATTYFPYGDSPSLWNYATYPRDGTNLLYAQNRYYSSQILRFTTADPHGGGLMVPQSLNRYAYAGNDPVNHQSSPSGLDPDYIMDWSWATRTGCYEFLGAGSWTYTSRRPAAGTHFVGSINVYSFAVAACRAGVADSNVRSRRRRHRPYPRDQRHDHEARVVRGSQSSRFRP